MNEIKKSASFKSKVKRKDKEVQFKIDLNYSPEYDSFNIKVKEGEGFMSYTWNIEVMPLDVVQRLNEMLEEVLIKAGSKTEMKEHKMSFGGDFQAGVYDEGGVIQDNLFVEHWLFVNKQLGSPKWQSQQSEDFDSVFKEVIDSYNRMLNFRNEPKVTSKENEQIKELALRFFKIKGFVTFNIVEGMANKIINPRLKLVYLHGSEIGMEKKIDLTDDNKLRLRKPIMPEKKLSEKEWIAKHNESKEARTYGFGGLFGKTILKPKPLNLDEKQVRLKTGEYVQVLDHAGDTLMVIDLNKLGSGAVAKKVKLSDVDMTSFKYGGALIGNQKRIDMNRNGKIDAEDFKLLRKSMNGAWRNERKHVNHEEDYEVRYAKPRPKRTGYKGKRKFANGGGISNAERLSRVVAKNYK